jgi:hypothetical protein
MRKPLSPNSLGHAFPTTTAGGSVVVFDDTQSGNGSPAPAPSYSHVTVSFKLDQAVTFIVKWAPERDAADSALLIINGSTETGEVAAANVFFSRDVVLRPGRNKIYVLMGTPAPTANFIAAEANTFDGLVS